MHKFLVSFALLLFVGCGSVPGVISGETNTTRDAHRQQTESPSDTAPKPGHDIVTAGDDQQVAEGKPVLLSASRLDSSKEFVDYLWREGDTVLAKGKACTLEDLAEGTHTITLEAVTENGERFVDHVTVVVKKPEPQNALPSASDLHFVTPEDTTFDSALRGNDPDGDPLRYLLVALPEHGQLSGSAAHLHYTPDADFYGEDRFIFKTNDGKIDSDPATVTITVEARNDAPEAESRQLTTDEGKALSLQLHASDKEQESLQYRIVTPPAHGRLSGTPPELTYSPDAGFVGTDRLTFLANDGEADSKIATVTITVADINYPPLIDDMALQTPEDTVLHATLTGRDPDGDSLSYRLVSVPQLGTAKISGDELIYTPYANRSGTEHLIYICNDGKVDSAVHRIEITILAQNDAPVAESLTDTLSEDSAKAIRLRATDAEADPLTYRIVTPPLHGSVTISGSEATYRPDADYFGRDSFSYRASDGKADSDIATIDLTIAAVNDAPTAQAIYRSTAEDSAVSIILNGHDVDGDSLSYHVTDTPAHGTLSGTPPALTYTPQSNYSGTDSFRYYVSDGKIDSDPATVTISVGAANDAPLADNKDLITAEDSALGIQLSGSDPDGDSLTFRVVTPPAHGTLSGTAPDLTYRPDRDYNGDDSFVYRANDGSLDSADATVTIGVTPVNDAPVANPQSLSISEDSSVAITLEGSDREQSPLTYTIVTQPHLGTLSGTPPNLTYTPDANRYGSDSFAFKVNDGTLDSAPATVTITVEAVNDIPVAEDLNLSTQEDTNLSVTLVGSDTDSGDTLSYRVVTPPAHGTLSGTAPNLTYRPNRDYNGADSFSYRVSDSRADSALATVTLQVEAVNDAPATTQQGTVTLDEDGSAAIKLLASDADGDTLTYILDTNASHGTLTDPDSSGNLTYMPDPNYYGADSFSYHVSDGVLRSDSRTVSIDVQSVNDAPVADAGADVTADEGVAITLNAGNSYDIDGSIVSYSWSENGIEFATAKILEKSDFSVGTHTVTLRVTDDGGLSATDTVLLTINAGSAGFTRVESGITIASARELFLRDIDQDGDLDMLIIGGSTTDSNISWYRNDGNLTIVSMGSIVTSQNLQAITIGDIDGDGDPDIVYGKDAVTLCLNDSNGSFSCQFDMLYNGFMKDDNMAALAIADMDGDGKKDIVVATDASMEHKLIFYRQQATTTNFARNDVTTLDSSIYAVTSIAVSDNDNDGDDDLLVANNGGLRYYRGESGYPYSSIHTSSLSKTAFLDVDGDDKLDAVSCYTDGRVEWDTLDSSVQRVQRWPGLDVDEDGYNDFVTSLGLGSDVAWYLNSADGDTSATFTKIVVEALNGVTIQDIAGGDLDGDGDTDLIVIDSQGSIHIYRNDR